MHSKDLEELMVRARALRENAYAPYSNFTVGAVLLCETGAIFEGVNVENASYGLSTCAERSAVSAAVTAGHRRFRALAVAGPPAATTTPCGACRQVLSEFSPSLDVMYTTPEGVERTTVDVLLPQAFGPETLDSNL